MDLRWIAAALFLASSLATGCYSPNIKGGGFFCGDGGACPSGYRCGVDKRCYSDSVDARIDLPVMCDAAVTLTPICATGPAQGQVCNPGCQRGCDCGWCAIVGGESKCLEGTPGTKDIGAICDPTRESDCKAGLYCQPECGTGRCYKPCDSSDNNDAGTNPACGPQSACDQKAAAPVPGMDGGTKSVPFNLCRLATSCDPTVASSSICPAPFACYPTGIGSQTDCECAGTIASGQGCRFLADCQAGNSCNGTGSGTLCLQTCTSSAQCTTGSCQNHTSTPFGYCM